MSTYAIKNKIFSIENLKKQDYSKNYLFLLKQLSSGLNPDTISKEKFDDFIDNLNDNHIIIILIDNEIDKIIGSVTILKEQKIIHNMGKVAHIEDVIIDNNYRGYGLGKKMIEQAKFLSKDCYKISLNCSDPNIDFYQKCNFSLKENQMTIYN